MSNPISALVSLVTGSSNTTVEKKEETNVKKESTNNIIVEPVENAEKKEPAVDSAEALPVLRSPSTSPDMNTTAATKQAAAVANQQASNSSSSTNDTASASSSSSKANSHPRGFHLTMVVIGKVTDTSARVLIEVLETATELTCHLKCVQKKCRELNTNPDGTSQLVKPGVNYPRDENGKEFTCTHKMVTGGQPKIFAFEGLEPDCRYEVSILNLAHDQPASQFRTLLKDWTITPDKPTMRFASVSCNLLSETLSLKPEQTDLWADLAARVQRDELDYVLHMGDQVYADEFRSDNSASAPVSAYAPDVHAEKDKGQLPLKKSDQLVFRKAMTMLENVPAEEWEKYRPNVNELYRQLYRETWTHRPTAVVLANVPNLTIYDDHDFVDNWGSLPHGRDKDRSTVDFFIATCARRVYYEYQGSLHRDVEDFSPQALEKIRRDHHAHVFGEYGVFFTESRGAGSFRYDKNDKTPFLGPEQWEDLEAAFAEDGLFKDCRHVLLVCPCPVVYLPHALNSISEPMVEDALGHWASAPFRAEQTRMLNLALAWQEGEGFGEEIKNIKAPPQPQEPAKTKDVAKEKGVKINKYPSIAGVARQVMEEEGEDEDEAKVDKEKSDKKDPDEKKSSSSSIPVVPCPPHKEPLTTVCRSNRRITFLGGDVHVGGHTRFYKHGHLVMEQLVSSAIANHILPSMAFRIGEMIQNSYTQLLDGWSFQHQAFTRLRNHGLIDTIRPKLGEDKERKRKPDVVTAIVHAD